MLLISLQSLQIECPLSHRKIVLFLLNLFEQLDEVWRLMIDDWHLRALLLFCVFDSWTPSIFIISFNNFIFLSLEPWRNSEFTVSMSVFMIVEYVCLPYTSVMNWSIKTKFQNRSAFEELCSCAGAGAYPWTINFTFSVRIFRSFQIYYLTDWLSITPIFAFTRCDTSSLMNYYETYISFRR